MALAPVAGLSFQWVRLEGRAAEGGFSAWKFINVVLCAAVISVAISVSNGGALAGLTPDAGGGAAIGPRPLCRQEAGAHAKVSTGH